MNIKTHTKTKTKRARWISILFIFARGLGMGTADVIPGVSGGTIALITGIYPRLIKAIETPRPSHALAFIQIFLAFNPTCRSKAIAKIKELDWAFLIPLLGGIGCALLIMVQIIPFVLQHYAYYAYAFFTGLILISITIPLREIKKTWLDFSILFSFMILFFFLTSLSGGTEANSHPLVLMLSGALAICVMILPGISGSYVLVLLGQYKLIAQAGRDLDVSVLAFFGLGTLVGIFAFVRILRFFLHRFFSQTMAALTGMMIGSLNGIWPLHFKPQDADQITLWLGGCGMVSAGAALVLIMEYLSAKLGKATNRNNPFFS